MENMWLGRYPIKGGLIDEKKMYNDTKKIFDSLNIQVDPRARVGNLPVSQKQMVEIAKAVSYNAKIIVMDEPTSSLTEKEVEHLFRIIDKLKKNNTSIIYISHKMEEILRISDDVTVMRDGKWISTKPAGELTIDSIIKMMVGRELTERYPKKEIGLAAVISASLLQQVDYAYRMYPHLQELPIFVPILLVMVLCAVLGLITGVAVAIFKVPPFIATLAMMLILYGLSSIYFDRPPYGAQPIGGITKKFTVLATGAIGIGAIKIPYLIIFALVVCAIIWVMWNKTKFGKYMYAVGGNPEAAKVSGVDVIRTQISVYAIAGLMYAFAAALEVARIGSASNTTGNGYEMDAVAACVVGGVSLSGGVGSVGGIVIGVLIFTVINYGLAFIGVNMYYQYIIKGLIILMAVIIDMRKYAKRK